MPPSLNKLKAPCLVCPKAGQKIVVMPLSDCVTFQVARLYLADSDSTAQVLGASTLTNLSGTAPQKLIPASTAARLVKLGAPCSKPLSHSFWMQLPKPTLPAAC